MITSQNQIFSDAQAITATAASTNQLDLGAPGTVYGAATALAWDAGKGNDIPLLVQVVETFATLTSLTVSVETDNDVAFGSAATVWTSGAIVAAKLVAGYRFNLTEMPEKVVERYIRLKYTVAGSDATAGKITAEVTMGNQTA